MSDWRQQPFVRSVAKILVCVMAIQAWPLWQLSHTYRWHPQRYVELLHRLGEFLGPQRVMADVPGMPGDLDEDCDVDVNDLNVILAGRNTPATGPDDPRDLDGDGVITVLDARKCVLLCTRPRCAVEPYKVAVPDVIGLEQAVALAALEANELTGGTITEEACDAGLAGTVIDQSRPAGAEVAPGCAIDLLVCSSGEDLCPEDPEKTEPGLCGCGVPDTDSDGDGIPDCIDPGDPPVADAGEDTEVFVPPGAFRDVVLDGTGSTDPDGTVVGYTWTGSPDPDDIAQPTVNLPAGLHTFSLVVTDNDGNDSDPDTVTITVTERAENLPPSITSMPLTVASVDYEYVYPVKAHDPNGDPLTCSLLTGPEGMTIGASAVVRWTPTADQVTDHPVSVQVDDGYGGTDAQTYWIRVSDSNSVAGNTVPIAHAGDDYTMEEGAQDILDGSYSFDADGDHLRYTWTQTGGPEVELDNRFAQRPGFTAPDVDANILLTFALTVHDSMADSEPDEVNIMVLNMDLPPGGNGIVTNSNLDGPGSLKAAIVYANDHPGTRITFNIPDSDPKYDSVRGVWQLPNASMGGTYGGAIGLHLHGVGWTLDGYSQSENQGDRNPFGPEIEIDDSAVGGTVGVSGDYGVIRGIAFTQPSNEKGVLMICPGRNMVVEGNHIGVDATGTTVRGNSGLVMASHACAEWGWGGGYYQNQFDPPPGWTVRVGGSRPGQGNIIATETFPSIRIGRYVGPESVTIQGNLIGCDRTGTIPLSPSGVRSIGTDKYAVTTHYQIGGVSPGSRNIIMNQVSLYVQDNEVVLQNNYIGTDISGSTAMAPNPAGSGIEVIDVDDGGSETAGSFLIGGRTPGTGNLISGFHNGIRLVTDRHENNFSLRIQGNLIGTDATGTQAIGNSYGIVSVSRPGGLIGGTGPNDGNIISGNQNEGIVLGNQDFLTIQGNKIGVGSDGVTSVPNGTGIRVGGFSYSIIGGTEAEAANIIAFNDGPGIEKRRWSAGTTSPTRASTLRCSGNQIHSNGGMGIAGAYITSLNEYFLEGMQNYPIVSVTEAGNGITRVVGNLSSSNPQNCLVEIFANRECDASGYGEGERWVAAVYPDADGSFETTVPENLSGLYLTATATRMTWVDPDPRINSSGFSPCKLVGDFATTNEPPVITSDPVTTATAETSYGYQVLANDPEGGPLSYALALAPEGMTIDSNGIVSWMPAVDQEGYQTVTVVVRDAQGLYASQNFRVQVLPLVDTEAPVVSVGIPPDLTIDSVYDIVGTISDPYLVWYGVEIAPAGSGNFRQIAEGTASVQNGVVGTIDPTILANGLYDGRVIAYDQDGHLTVFNLSAPIEIDTKLKIGRFSLAFQDISIPVAGIPITVTRTYNSFDKEKGDFGVGWYGDLMSGVKIQTTRTLGTGWQAVESGSFLGSPTYDLVTDNLPKVLVTYANGRQDRFEFTPYFVTQPTIAPDWVQPAFTALEGTTATLEAVGASDLFLDNGQLLDLGATEVGPFDPDRFRLTTAEGIVYVISRSSGLESITDRNGNTLNFGPGGITHSAGLSINMDRDSEGRVTRITDPMGYEVAYDYDGNGDLIEFTDQEGNVTRYGYDDEHNLVSIIDPRGIEVLETAYDEQGRMIGTTDALGNVTTFVHDTENAVEYVTDRLGYTTAYEYDTDGNVISIRDPLGNVTTFTYDDRGNELSKTDALGNTTTWTYDDRDNRLTETHPLGNTTSWTYNDRNQILTKTDPLGNVTTYTYDGSGNRLTRTDALGNMTSYAYDGAGNMISMTDCEGNVISYTYDSHGNKLSETDALGNVTTYAYDSNGNLLAVTDPLGNTTTRAYDHLGNLIMTTDPLGNSEITEYNEIGKKSAEVDKNGNRTEYEYDENGNLVQTSYPDGTAEAQTYDENGNKITLTDRAGRITQYEYDPVGYEDPEQGKQGRLAGIVYPDGSTNRYEYDGAGRMRAIIDESGNRTEFEYDAAGRRTSTTDPMGNITSFSYDANGNQRGMTDANGHSTSYVYDALNRRVQTVFADGTSTLQEYAAGCCSGCSDKKISETDQAGATTVFDYDALGRLIQVTDALGGETVYTYDAVGNRLTQTDANGHTTSFTYDGSGRILSRTLPMGQSESFAYDADGNLLEKTDFNGDTIAYSYDSMNRLTRKQYPDTSEVLFTHTPTGKRATATDSRGITAYTYDVRDRLLEVENPDGTSIAYTYDARGNRISVTVPSGTTGYAYDALNRLERVTDPDAGVTDYAYDDVGNRTGVVYPNGTVAEYVYDSLNRLVYMENRKSTGEILSSHAYTLGPAGNRVRLAEDTGRIVDYTYDSLYRLIEEDISDPAVGDETIGYTYDAVGNRLARANAIGITSYTYNANDQLLTETNPLYSRTYGYDKNGNTTSRTTGSDTDLYGYDCENRLIGAQTAAGVLSYRYDVGGNRVRATVNGDETGYLVDGNRRYSQVLEERDGAGVLIADYVHGDDLIRQRRVGVSSYYHYDGQMSTRALTDASESATDRYVYDAFGNLMNRTGTTENPYLYTGEQYDPNVGFYYLRARYYDQNTGRFITHDPVLGFLFDPASLHRYLYVKANPCNAVDPGGEMPFSLIEALVVVAVLGSLAIAKHAMQRSWFNFKFNAQEDVFCWRPGDAERQFERYDRAYERFLQQAPLRSYAHELTEYFTLHVRNTCCLVYTQTYFYCQNIGLLPGRGLSVVQCGYGRYMDDFVYKRYFPWRTAYTGSSTRERCW